MKSAALIALAGIVGIASSARADDIVYGNGATFGPDIVYKYDINIGAGTATLLKQYNVSSGNGRGVVVVGNTMYTTQSGPNNNPFGGDNKIYKTDVTTGASLGTITTGQSQMSTLAWDGSQFWVSQYLGGGDAYRIDLNGNTTKTISLGSFDGKDGMEYFNGNLIANRGDTVSPYDIYNLSGTLLKNSFIAPTTSSTGIAFDGTDFITSNIFNQSVSIWDGTTGSFIKTIALPGTSEIEDLSVDYSTRADTGGGGNTVPDTGSTAALLGIAFLALFAGRARRTSHSILVP